MSSLDDRLAQYSKLAIETGAEELGMRPLNLAQQLNQGEIGRLVHLLNAALQHVEHTRLRRRIEDVLLSITEGRMPKDSAESELDWALKVSRRRRADESRRGPDPDEDREDGEDEEDQ